MGRKRELRDLKVSVKLSAVDLGMIDFAIAEGAMKNRSDLIRAAIRRELMRDGHWTSKVIERKRISVGSFRFDRRSLEELLANGEKPPREVVGLLEIDDDVPLDLAERAFGLVLVHGVFRARAEIRDRLLYRPRR